MPTPALDASPRFTSKALMEIPNKEQVAQQKTHWQSHDWIFTDPNGTAPMHATPYRAQKTYFFPNALSWISLIGGMARPRVNSRSTNFWARIGQFFDRVDDIGSLSSPSKSYGIDSIANKTGSKTIFKFDSIKNLEYRFNEQGECYDTLYLKTPIKDFKNSTGIKISKEEWEKLDKLW